MGAPGFGAVASARNAELGAFLLTLGGVSSVLFFLSYHRRIKALELGYTPRLDVFRDKWVVAFGMLLVMLGMGTSVAFVLMI